MNSVICLKVSIPTQAKLDRHYYLLDFKRLNFYDLDLKVKAIEFMKNKFNQSSKNNLPDV